MTFEKLRDYDRNKDYPSPDFNINELKFNWHDKTILKEIEHSNKDYHGHRDFFFGIKNGKSWYLNNKILIKKSTS